MTQAVILGMIQGVTEFLPISSSAHLVLTPWIFGWRYQGLTYDVALHWGTLLALVGFFWRDWWNLIFLGFTRSHSLERRLLFSIILATIPAAVAGYFLEDLAENAFRQPDRIALCLVFFGLLLGLAEWTGRKQKNFESLGLWRIFFIGLAQALAIVPGVSRSGVTITAALALGLNRESSARFSFLLAMPIIFGAGLLKLKTVHFSDLSVTFFVGVATAAITGALAIWFFLLYAKKRDFGVFVFYRICLGGLILFLWAGNPILLKEKLSMLTESLGLAK